MIKFLKKKNREKYRRMKRADKLIKEFYKTCAPGYCSGLDMVKTKSMNDVHYYHSVILKDYVSHKDDDIVKSFGKLFEYIYYPDGRPK